MFQRLPGFTAEAIGLGQPGGGTAIHHQGGAVHKGRFVGGQVDTGPGHILRPAYPAERLVPGAHALVRCFERGCLAGFAEFPQLAGAPLLTLPARGTRLKGHADAIRLVADLKARAIETRLILLGVRQSGREAYVAELEKLAVELGVDGWVAMSAQREDAKDVCAASALVLQLSNKPESFGRTVIEAISLCRPVLGYDHGGVGELLTDLYPAGRVPPGDRERLTERAAQLLSAAPPITPLDRYRLVDMQAATLALYANLVSGSPATS